MAQPRTLHQNFIDEDIEPLAILEVHESDLTKKLLRPFTKDPRPVGIAAAYSDSGSNLVVLAISNQNRVLLVEFYPKPDGNGKVKPQPDCMGRPLLQQLLSRPLGDIFAFDLHLIAIALYYDVGGMRVINGVDIQSACATKGDRQPLTSIRTAVADKATIYADNIKQVFADISYDPKRTQEVALRAWVAQYLPQLGDMEDTFAKAKRIDTKKLPDVLLNLLAKTIRDGQRLDGQKPTYVTRDLAVTYGGMGGQLTAKADRYQNKMRKSAQQSLRVTIGPTAQRGYVLPGQVADASGKSAELELSGRAAEHLEEKVIGTMTIIGRDGPTNAERKREETLLRVLQGDTQAFQDNPWILNICLLPPDDYAWPSTMSTKSLREAKEPDFSALERPLNSSQLHAVKQMLSMADDSRITLIQGPPGTGKTTVIATYVHFATSGGQKGIWLTAQSNVAVKNIAEKLCDFGFMDWKLLVSKDFHFEWHEHIYSKIAGHIIRSDAFNDPTLRAKIKDCKVILCTLSMLSNPFLSRFTFANPVTTLVIDEASQIEIGDYISVFDKYAFSLRKVCFIGDDKQLPPHGQEEIDTLQSVFEVSHLRSSAIFLDTQYRMPPQIGDFISKSVYDSQLQSNPHHPITDKIIACYLIDVSDGKETRQETSFKNLGEIAAALQIAAELQAQEKSFRIITPYDAQRNALERGMEEKGLDMRDKCFNVDSFQGNEDDYIIISTVRSQELGFLKNLRRTNVMLTRCKKGMFICTSRAFLESWGKKSLVAEMAAEFGDKAWVDLKDLEDVLSKL